jgi:hypothetical protein
MIMSGLLQALLSRGAAGLPMGGGDASNAVCHIPRASDA